MADTMTVTEIESAIDAIETQGRYITLHGLPGACPSKQDCRAFESFMRSGYAAKEKLRRMATAIKQREQGAKDARTPDFIDVSFEVWQNDEMVASCSGPEPRALTEAKHYASQYAQDGPVSVFRVSRVRINAAMAKESGR
jgi:hypothetical protein